MNAMVRMSCHVLCTIAQHSLLWRAIPQHECYGAHVMSWQAWTTPRGTTRALQPRSTPSSRTTCSPRPRRAAASTGTARPRKLWQALVPGDVPARRLSTWLVARPTLRTRKSSSAEGHAGIPLKPVPTPSGSLLKEQPVRHGRRKGLALKSAQNDVRRPRREERRAVVLARGAATT